MNYIEKYKQERSKGKNEYESFGIVATYIAIKGNFKDLEKLFDLHIDDFTGEMEKCIDGDSNLTSYERDMKLSGHKESDFE